jgi:hypothetical protein
MLAAADVERPIDHDVELEAGAGSELKQAHPALDSVADGDEPHARRLVEPAHTSCEICTRQLATVELRHRA